MLIVLITEHSGIFDRLTKKYVVLFTVFLNVQGR